MRHIPLRSQKPDAAWVARASTLLEELKNAPDASARNQIIDDNSDVWGELKQWLLDLSHQKCWFSEAKDCFNHWDVEHFRPKKIPKKGFDPNLHHAYWWLAFDWKNFRICGNVGNRKKGAEFPLQSGCQRCTPHGDLRTEEPLLLDPIDQYDPTLLSFDFEGNAIPAAHVVNPFDKNRVTYSVERYKLDFPPLVNKRKAVWSDCWSRIQEYLSNLNCFDQDRSNGAAKEGVQQTARFIREMIQPEKELSAVARACIVSSGDPRVLALLQSN